MSIKEDNIHHNFLSYFSILTYIYNFIYLFVFLRSCLFYLNHIKYK